MLQRAASNAYSWWWAGHIRTKQSKWLEQSLQDMEEKVQHVLKLIEEDGDSFAKRAEMYYKKRPELISFVEESYRAYRALAERYDHISTELQNANTTIATVFPEQVQFAMDDEDESNFPKMPKDFSQVSETNAPKVPNFPNKDLKSVLASKATKKLQARKSPEPANNAKSGISKAEALEEIDKLQKEILALQTVKEFVKSSYESGVAKFWEIEKEITEKQERVSTLQDKFNVGTVIDDDEARNLMAETALKSCEQTLARLHEKQETSRKEARSESTRIEDAREKLNSLKDEFLPIQNEQESHDRDKSVKSEEKTQSLKRDTDIDKLEIERLESLRDKVKEHFDSGSGESLSVSEMAEKIDELVNKVISLESAVSSQTVLIDRLRTEIDDLQMQIQSLEDEKANLITDKNDLISKLREMEAKLKRIQDLHENVEQQNNNILTHFTEARSSLDQISQKLHSVKPDEEIEITESLQQKEETSTFEAKLKENKEREKSVKSTDLKAKATENKHEQVLGKSVNTNPKAISEKGQVTKSLDELSRTLNNLYEAEEVAREKTEMNWQEMLLNGLEDREKILLTEYTEILRDYKDLKKQLGDLEKKNRDSHFEMTVQVREMRSAIAERDEEIQSLRQKLNFLQESYNGSKDQKDDFRVISVLSNDRSAKPESPNQKAKKEEEDIKLIFVDESQAVSQIEEKLRMNIDAILDENLDFWLRFCTSFHQIQKFKTEVKDLQGDITKFKEKEKMKKEGSSIITDLKSDVRAIYKHLREIETELTVWSEKSVLLKDELQRRFSSLCNIQEDITTALKEGVEEDEMKFTSYQAAKFQGEVLNMKQENNKVRDELQVGLDHVSALQLEIEKTLAKLDDEYELSGSKNRNRPQLQHSETRSRVPLRAFIFGTKPKKQKYSIFSRVNSALHRKSHGFPM